MEVLPGREDQEFEARVLQRKDRKWCKRCVSSVSVDRTIQDSNHQLPSQPTPRPRNQNMNNESQSSEGRRFSPLWIVSLHGFWTMVTIAVVTFAVAMMVTVPLGLLGVMDPSWPVYFYLKVLQSAALTHMLSAYASFTERLRFNFQVIMAFMNQTGIRYAFVALTYCSYGHLIGCS